jgi:hypothetical protein
MSVDEYTAPGQVSVPGWFRRAWTYFVDTYTDPIFLTFLRWCAIVVWVFAVARQCWYFGIPFDREGLMLWLATGVAALTLGKRNVASVVIDWLPFAAVLIAYDYARGAADTVGMPTWWTPQITVDKALFAGTEPTVWLQAHLKDSTARWWDAVVCLVYVSFFFLPYVAAAVFWVRSRREFRRWTVRFVTLSFTGFGLFALFPAAPPWAAARCTPAEVANHPHAPACLGHDAQLVSNGGLLGPMTHVRAGAHAWIERISGRGWGMLHLSQAQIVLHKGQGIVDLVAAVPSLHAGGTMLFTLFIRDRVNRGWRLVLVAYNLLMAFALVYSAEHYVADILAGWLLAFAVMAFYGWLERRKSASRAPDTLNATNQQPVMESPCPATVTTPSST